MMMEKRVKLGKADRKEVHVGCAQKRQGGKLPVLWPNRVLKFKGKVGTGMAPILSHKNVWTLSEAQPWKRVPGWVSPVNLRKS